MGWPELSYRELVERVSAVFYVDTADEWSSALYMSPQTDSMFGYSRGEWLEDPELWVKVLHPDDKERVLAEDDRARRTGAIFEAEYRMIDRDGSVVWVRGEAVPVGEDGGGLGRRVGVTLDITDRKLYEEKLRKSEERFRKLVENAMEGIAWISPEDVIVQCNLAYARLLCLTPDEAVGRSFFEFLEGEDERQARHQWELRLSGVRSEYEVSITTADGKRKVLSCCGYPLYGTDGSYEGAVQTVSDVTEFRECERALRASEEMFRRTFEAAGVGMAHVAPDGRWLRINDKLLEIVGYFREELLALTFQDITHPDDLEKDLENARLMLLGEIERYHMEKRYVRRDGMRVWIDLTVSALRSDSGEISCFIAVVDDITQRKLTELIPDPLTERELKVLWRIVVGHKNGRIAEDLHHSLGTIKQDVRNIIAKLGTSDRRRAATRAIDIGLTPPP